MATFAIASLAIQCHAPAIPEETPQIHDSDRRIVQNYSDGLTGGAVANLNMRTSNDYEYFAVYQLSDDHF